MPPELLDEFDQKAKEWPCDITMCFVHGPYLLTVYERTWSGTIKYLKNGSIHRVDGPAAMVKTIGGEIQNYFWYKGMNVTNEDHHLFTGKDEDILTLELKYG